MKLAGAHAGISVGPDGATHQSLEDVALMRVLPGMTVVVPCDAEETRKATLAIAEKEGPCFIRFGREAVPEVTDKNSPFIIGKLNLMADGGDVTIFANGAMVYEALTAAMEMKAEGIDAMVVNLHTVKPLDEEGILRLAGKTGCAVTAEEHQIAGGMGSAVAECLAAHLPIPLEMVGVRDSFGESGRPQELMGKYGLNKDAIKEAVRKGIMRK